MKTVKKLLCLTVLHMMLWIYSAKIKGIPADFTALMRLWMTDFRGLDASCIHWIAIRIVIWIYVLWEMLWLEQGFALYLFVRERNYRKMFVKQYVKCIGDVLLYFGMQTAIFALLFVKNGGAPGNVLHSIAGIDLWVAIGSEALGALNLCLLVYFLYCVTKKAELGFLIVLGMRLSVGFAIGNISQYTKERLIVNMAAAVLLLAVVINFAGFYFYKRIQGEI